MNLITPLTLTAPQEALLTIQQLNSEGLQELAEKTKRAFALFWHNERATRAEMAAAIGPNAGAAFAAHAATVQFLLSQDASLLSPADYTPPQAYTINQDGTISLL
jgi:hypothetical protein